MLCLNALLASFSIVVAPVTPQDNSFFFLVADELSSPTAFGSPLSWSFSRMSTRMSPYLEIWEARFDHLPKF